MMRLAAFILLILFSSNLFSQDSAKDSTEQKFVIGEISIVGNRTTKRHIILRELTFSSGTTVSLKQLQKELIDSKNNLQNTSLFNFVTINTLTDGNKINVVIIVTERWYLWPVVTFELAETNFNAWWENKDFSRINYGLGVRKDNFRGRNEKLTLNFQFGFTEKISIGYSVPYINKGRKLGFSIGFDYGQNHEVNYVSEFNKRQFYKDIDNYMKKHYRGSLSFDYRPKIRSRHGITLQYFHVEIDDTIRSFNPNYIENDKTLSEYLALSYRFSIDNRNNKPYPLTGDYFGFEASQIGFGVLNPDIQLFRVGIQYKYFLQLASRHFLAASARAQLSPDDLQPYYLQPGLGYSDKSTIRSFELYVIDGHQWGIGKVQYRFQVIRPREKEFGFIPVNKFKRVHYAAYLGLFSDFGYSVDNDVIPNNELANEFNYGGGVSIDFVTFYDLVYRTEFSINKLGESGIFLHFVAPI